MLDTQARSLERRLILGVGEERRLVTLREVLDPFGGPDELAEVQDRESALPPGDRHPRDLELGLVDGEQVRSCRHPPSGVSQGSTIRSPVGLRWAAIAGSR